MIYPRFYLFKLANSKNLLKPLKILIRKSLDLLKRVWKLLCELSMSSLKNKEDFECSSLSLMLQCADIAAWSAEIWTLSVAPHAFNFFRFQSRGHNLQSAKTFHIKFPFRNRIPKMLSSSETLLKKEAEYKQSYLPKFLHRLDALLLRYVGKKILSL